MEETKKKAKRSVVKRATKAAAREAAKTGGYAVASLNEVPTSPRKMRLVADLIRGERVSKALNVLKHEAKHPTLKLEKLLLSAVSNWELKNPDLNLEEADLFVKEIYVNGGRVLKRIRPAPQGRAHRIRKRSNHVTLIIDSREGKKTKGEDSKQEENKKNKKANGAES